MAGKIILNADLYDNVLTEKPCDYVVIPSVSQGLTAIRMWLPISPPVS